ncbi:MAG: RNA polymerase sigma factor [Pseudobacter sp.]|uniref:RNA polymerase sigma factor n=1 Tax=Pseudobacter sp. TaxID=2045420 RepID=UPI003F80D609
MPTYDAAPQLDPPTREEELVFREIYDQWHARIYSLSMYVTRSAFMSEEITQDVFLKLWNQRSSLAQIEHLPAWIRTITINTTINYLRKKAREQLLLKNYLEQAHEQTDDGFQGLRERELAGLLQGIVKDLSPQQQKVWELTRGGGMTLEQAAIEMGITRNTAKEHLARAIKTIRSRMDGHIELMVTAAVGLFL